MTSVTVLMPVYNGERYLRETMQSILSQTFLDYEFLIIDDGSTDKTLEIINTFTDPRIRVLRNPRRLKLSGALNRGLDESLGHYIARMDADDIAHPERLAQQVDFLDSHPDIGVCGTWIEKFGLGKKTVDRYLEKSGQIKVYSLFDCPFAHPTVMCRKELLNKHGLRYDGSYYPTEDYELWSRAIEKFSCANIPETLLKYRVHASSMTRSDWQEMDTKAAEIAGKQLCKLGLDLNNDELLFHRNMGRGESFRSSDIVEVRRGDLWLKRLISANNAKKIYNDIDFLEVLSLIWFRFCFQAAPLGFGVLHCYSTSPLWQKDKRKAQRIVTLGLSIIKNKFLRP